VRDAVTLGSSRQSTENPLTAFNPHASSETAGTVASAVGAALVVGGAAVLAYAAYTSRDRSWRAAGLALAGVPLVYRGTTGNWLPRGRWVPRAISGGEADEAPAPLPNLRASVTIDRPAGELYEYWRQLSNLPRFMKHLESVVETGDGRSHWVGKTPIGWKAEWDAEITAEETGRRLAWRSLPGSEIETGGEVRFTAATGNRGTMVFVTMEAGLPGNALGRVVAPVVHQGTERQVREDLRRFKELMEAGEIATIDGQPAGHRPLINIGNPL
jgi:uncharacterized membrane protein